MKKACIVLDPFYSNNKLFDTNNEIVNRDNCCHRFGLLKEKFEKHNVNLSTSDLNTIEDSEIVLYLNLPKALPQGQDIEKSFLIISESEVIRPDNWNFEAHNHFNKIFTWKDDIIDNKKYFKLNYSHLIPKKINKDISRKDKFCNLVAGNKRSRHPLELYSKRIEAIRWFEQNHPDEFDLYGMGWEKDKDVFPSYKGTIKSKKETMEQYKFSICFENARDIKGYITEKIFDCFFAGCIPVYLGADNINDHIPENCFIDWKKFNDYELLYDFMKMMDDKVYLQYLNNIEEYLNSDAIYQYSSEYYVDTIINETLSAILTGSGN